MHPTSAYSSLRSRIPEGLDEVRVVLEAVIKDKEQYKKILEAQGDEAQQFLDALHALSGSPDVEDELRPSILKLMLRLSRRSGLCPNCLNINHVERIGERPIDGGGFGDVWKGKIDDQLVCLKVVKVYLMSDVQELLKEYMREAILWQQLRHPNLLPFMGMYYLDETREQLCLVSPWMDRGNLVKYLKGTPPELVDHQALAYDVASGLAHLHSMNIIHGDLKGVNVLMTPDERACITDFGLSRVADTYSLCLTSSMKGQRGTTRWSAPELLRSDPPSSVSMKSDMYAYACVCCEIFTGGNVPFYGFAEGAVMVAVVVDKKYPVRPSGVRELTDDMWGIMVECWNHDAQKRPEAKDVRSDIGALYSQKTRHQVQSYPASEWNAHPLAQMQRHVGYPSVDFPAIVRFLLRGCPPGGVPSVPHHPIFYENVTPSGTSTPDSLDSLEQGFQFVSDTLSLPPPAVPRSPISEASKWPTDPLPTPMWISILPKASCSLSGVDKSLYDSSSSLGAEGHPRPIRDIDPRITLTYYSLLGPSARSCFDVYRSHGRLIHTDDSPLTLLSTSDDGTYYYSTVLVPGFWETLCNHSDPTEFTIEHKVIQDTPLEPLLLYTAVYKFRYPKRIGAGPELTKQRTTTSRGRRSQGHLPRDQRDPNQHIRKRPKLSKGITTHGTRSEETRNHYKKPGGGT